MRLLAILALLVASAPYAWAGELTTSQRRAAERAFLEGRLEDLDALLRDAASDADRYPLALRDLWWRTSAGAAPTEPPHPAALGGGGARWPLLEALRADRVRREARGAAGLPEDGPLYALARGLDETGFADELWYLDDDFRLMKETYVAPWQLPRAEVEHYERLTLTAKASALGALGAFVVLCFFAALLVVRRRPEVRGSQA